MQHVLWHVTTGNQSGATAEVMEQFKHCSSLDGAGRSVGLPLMDLETALALALTPILALALE